MDIAPERWVSNDGIAPRTTNQHQTGKGSSSVILSLAKNETEDVKGKALDWGNERSKWRDGVFDNGALFSGLPVRINGFVLGVIKHASLALECAMSKFCFAFGWDMRWEATRSRKAVDVLDLQDRELA